jgi:hypothetical protein
MDSVDHKMEEGGEQKGQQSSELVFAQVVSVFFFK